MRYTVLHPASKEHGDCGIAKKGERCYTPNFSPDAPLGGVITRNLRTLSILRGLPPLAMRRLRISDNTITRYLFETLDAAARCLCKPNLATAICLVKRFFDVFAFNFVAHCAKMTAKENGERLVSSISQRSRVQRRSA